MKFSFKAHIIFIFYLSFFRSLTEEPQTKSHKRIIYYS